MADATSIKDAIRWMWSLGDYGALAEHLEPHAIEIAHRCGIHHGSLVLDVAAGNGNFAIAAARLGATVVATDLTPSMVELGRSRTSDLGLQIEWLEADAEDLPFPGSQFDVVASVFGAMFAPRPEQVAAELFRVTKVGGLVGMANYGQKGFLPRFTALLNAYGPAAPPGTPSAFEWGDRDEVHRRFAGRTSAIEVYPQTLSFHFDSLEAGWQFWKDTNPPLIALLTMLTPERRAELTEEAKRMFAELNRSGSGLTLESDYLQVLARKA
jgi:ubiquinone/menaquinone biosynthesis C-methylase UbiE